MDLSVIVPVYNTADTLRHCVESILRQADVQMELILVDDQSPDAAPQLCDRLAQEHASISVLHVPHGGLGHARNQGLAVAQGTYVTFVDSDDLLAPDTYAPLLDYLKSNPHTDIAEYPIRKCSAKGEQYLVAPQESVHYPTLRQYWLQQKGYRHAYACNKIFRRSIFEHHQFAEGQPFEDVELMSRLLFESLTIACLPMGCYLYQANPAGISATADARAIAHQLQIHTQLYNQMPDADYFEAILSLAIDLYDASGIVPNLPQKRFTKTLKQKLLYLLGIKNLCRIRKTMFKWIR